MGLNEGIEKMMKIELVGIYKINYCRENIEKYKIEENILYYKEKIICKINYQALINKNKLFVFRNNLIEEYEIKKKKEKKKEHKIEMRGIFKEQIPILENIPRKLLPNNNDTNNLENIPRKLIPNNNDTNNLENIPRKLIPNNNDTNNLETPVFTNYESNACTKDYKEIYNINQITISNNTENKKTSFFFKEGKIHLTYLTYLVTLPCKDIIYKFKIERNMSEMTYFSINNNPKSIYKMYLVLSIFLNIKVNTENKETHKFVHELCLFKNSLARQITFNVFSTSVLVDLYRKIEDKSLIEFDFEKLSFKDMKKVVLCSFDDNIIIFLDKCVSENREWEIKNIIRIFRDADEFWIIVNWLIKRNCFYYLGDIFGLEVAPIMKIEKCVMMSHLGNKKYCKKY